MLLAAPGLTKNMTGYGEFECDKNATIQKYKLCNAAKRRLRGEKTFKI